MIDVVDICEKRIFIYWPILSARVSIVNKHNRMILDDDVSQ